MQESQARRLYTWPCKNTQMNLDRFWSFLKQRVRTEVTAGIYLKGTRYWLSAFSGLPGDDSHVETFKAHDDDNDDDDDLGSAA